MNGAPPPGSTNTPPQRPERVLAIAALAAILFLQPFLGIFDKGAGLTWAGIPALFAYIFFAWSVIVALTAFVMERRAEAEHDASLVFHADDPQRPQPLQPGKGDANNQAGGISGRAQRTPGEQ